MYREYKVIGIMSGTSLDGVDFAFCKFAEVNAQWSYEICKAITIPYSLDWKDRLSKAYLLNGFELTQLDRNYGQYLAELVLHFLIDMNSKPDFISSHGHTVFHQPSKGFTLQIGNGAVLSALTGLPVINDFRSGDVALSGQGAPLVPIGDQLLFAGYDACLNLGGFANISFEKNTKRVAFDICPVNLVLNKLAEVFGLTFDVDGKVGAGGKINYDLLRQLNDLEFYRKPFPKSLGREWVDEFVLPLINRWENTQNTLATIYEHISFQIASIINDNKLKAILVTGGGAMNSFLIQLINQKIDQSLIIPENDIINFKEALIFAFMGVLNLQSKPNCLASVTGAISDSIGGARYGIKI